MKFEADCPAVADLMTCDVVLAVQLELQSGRRHKAAQDYRKFRPFQQHPDFVRKSICHMHVHWDAFGCSSNISDGDDDDVVVAAVFLW